MLVRLRKHRIILLVVELATAGGNNRGRGRRGALRVLVVPSSGRHDCGYVFVEVLVLVKCKIGRTESQGGVDSYCCPGRERAKAKSLFELFVGLLELKVAFCLRGQLRRGEWKGDFELGWKESERNPRGCRKLVGWLALVIAES